MSALTLAILTETYPVERRAGAFGMWAAISGLGFGLGPVVGGALLSVFSWSSVFWVNVPFAVAGFVIAYVAVTESRNPEGRALDVVGMIAVALGLLGITFGLIESSSHPWASLDVAARWWSASSWWCSSSSGRAARRRRCSRRACCGPAASSPGAASIC